MSQVNVGNLESINTTHSRFALSCIVPVFNEGAHVAQFLESLHRKAATLTSEVEIIVVNDGSIDNSAAEIARVAQRLPIHYLGLSRNFSKEIARRDSMRCKATVRLFWTRIFNIRSRPSI